LLGKNDILKNSVYFAIP